jgi:Concanavalin A-like lectin/glucanases superfamily
VTLLVFDRLSPFPASTINNGLILQWLPNGDAEIIDHSGRGNKAVLLGGAALVSSSIGPAKSAVSFDGKGAFALKQGMQPDVPDMLSLSLWANVRENVGGFRGIISAQTAGNDFEEGFSLDLCIPPSETFDCLNIQGAGLAPRAWNAKFSKTPVGEWTHIVVVFGIGPEGVKTYSQGKPQGGAERNAAPIKFANIRLGARFYNGNLTSPFNGELSNIRIYDRVLSSTEAAYLFQIDR